MRTSAGLGSVIIDSQPLTVALLAAALFGEEIGATGVAGMLAGVAGLCMLEVPPSALAQLLHPALGDAVAQVAAGSDAAAVAAAAGSWSLWDSGEWWMLLAAQSMAVGTVMVRWVAGYCDPVVRAWAGLEPAAGSSCQHGSATSHSCDRLSMPALAVQVATGWHMILGGLPLVALALAQGPGGTAEVGDLLSQLTGVFELQG